MKGVAMQPYVLNRHGRMVFPSNFLPELDLSVIDSARTARQGDPP